MNTELAVAPNVKIDARTEALYITSSGRQLFAWLHWPAAGPIRRVGVVICKAFGYESVCSHRSVAAFADGLADLGIPALRFDYAGTADSEDIPGEADQLTAWSRDAVAAADELCKRACVERVHFLGFRLGALIAVLAASQSPAVEGLILIAPVVNGRRYLRELRATRMAASIGLSEAEMEADAKSSSGTMEISGFSLSAATLASLTDIDFMTRDPPRVANALIMDSSSLPTAREWSGRLSSVGISVSYEAHTGVVEMLMTDPYLALPPNSMLQSMRTWLEPLIPIGIAGDPGVCRSSARYTSVPRPALRLLVEGPDPRRELSERPVFLGPDGMLVGIVTEPSAGDKRRRGVVLLNVGAENHIGPSRLYVTLARHWANHGYTVLRLDLAGLGDSRARPGTPPNVVFPPAAIEDIGVAIDFMRQHYGTGDITLGGLCSGAYHSFRAAVAGLHVNRILLVNPMNFLSDAGLDVENRVSAENVQRSIDVARNFDFYRDRICSLAIWRRVIRGDLHIWRIVRIPLQRPLLVIRSIVNDLARNCGLHVPGDLGWELEQIARRGVKIVFVFARNEPGIDVLKLHAGSTVRRLGGRCVVHIIDSGDHIFTRSRTRNQLQELLTEELFNRNPVAMARAIT